VEGKKDEGRKLEGMKHFISYMHGESCIMCSICTCKSLHPLNQSKKSGFGVERGIVLSLLREIKQPQNEFHVSNPS
jgi:hypothetical protein